MTANTDARGNIGKRYMSKEQWKINENWSVQNVGQDNLFSDFKAVHSRNHQFDARMSFNFLKSFQFSKRPLKLHLIETKETIKRFTKNIFYLSYLSFSCLIRTFHNLFKTGKFYCFFKKIAIVVWFNNKIKTRDEQRKTWHTFNQIFKIIVRFYVYFFFLEEKNSGRLDKFLSLFDL